MRGLNASILPLVDWLRRPERLVRKLQALSPNRTFPRLPQLDELARQSGIEVIEVPLNPGVEGVATYADGKPIILLRAGLVAFNRQFVLAHEMAHIHLHLTPVDNREILTAYAPGGNVDVEADTYAILCLMETLPLERILSDGIKYMMTNRNMPRRAFRVIRYFSGYRLRVTLAWILEQLLPPSMVKGTT